MGLMGTSRFGISGATQRQPIAPPAPTSPSEFPNGGSGSGSALGNVFIPSTGIGGSQPRAAQQAQYVRSSGATTNFGAGGPIMGSGGSAGANQWGGQVNEANNNGGVATGGQTPGMNAVQNYQNQGPDLAAIQAEMARKNVGAQLNANPQNSALAGYLMG